MRLYHNLASMNLYRKYKDNLQTQSTAFGRVSSGLKVQSSKDSPEAMAESQKLRLQIRGLQMSSRNMQDGISMLQTADGAIQSLAESVHRIRELMVRGKGATSNEEKQAAQKEVDEMLKHINTLAENTETNGVKLLSKDNEAGSSTTILTGAMAEEEIKLPKFNLTAEGLGIQDVKVNSIDSSLQSLDNAITTISKYRGKYGAIANRLESTYNNASEIAIRVEESEANLTGADIAYEMMEYSKASILVDSGIAMMTQTNKFPQDILRILENVKSR